MPINTANANSDWLLLDRLAQGEYDQTLAETLAEPDQEFAFRRVGRLFGVYLKEPFALNFEYDPNVPTNWAKSRRYWEIHELPDEGIIAANEAQFALLEKIAREWNRPIEYVAEFNVFLSLCRRFRPIACGEAKALEDVEKIAKDLEKQGTPTAMLSLNQGLGIAAAAMAAYLVQQLPDLSDYSPIVTGASLLFLCFGQRKLCQFMTSFEATYDEKKDSFATRQFYVCGSTSTRNGTPCGALVHSPGQRCARHA
jgi:hypothetical protein